MPSPTSRHGECSAKKAVVTELRWTSTPACSKRSSGYSSLRPMNKPPGAGRVGGDAEDVHPAGGVLNDEERIQPAQGDRLQMQQVAGQDRVRLRPQEPAPRWFGPTRRGIDPGCLQDGPDGRGADPVAQPGELAVDSPVPPRRILGGQARDEGAQAGGDGRSTGPDGRRCPAAGDELAVPAQDGGRGDEQAEAAGRGE